MMNSWIPAAGLIVIGSIQMAGDLSGQWAIKAAGAALQASPAPKVFTAQEGFETFSSRFFIEWTDPHGRMHSIEFTPRTYRNLKGPYNRRNAYGAALSYAPVLAANPRTRPMLDLVMRHAFCNEAPLLAELGIARDELVYPLWLVLQPRENASRTARWQTTFTVQCNIT
jgi:hypothetical protein